VVQAIFNRWRANSPSAAAKSLSESFVGAGRGLAYAYSVAVAAATAFFMSRMATSWGLWLQPSERVPPATFQVVMRFGHLLAVSSTIYGSAIQPNRFHNNQKKDMYTIIDSWLLLIQSIHTTTTAQAYLRRPSRTNEVCSRGFNCVLSNFALVLAIENSTARSATQHQPIERHKSHVNKDRRTAILRKRLPHTHPFIILFSSDQWTLVSCPHRSHLM
jgi:hypothetical protein